MKFFLMLLIMASSVWSRTMVNCDRAFNETQIKKEASITRVLEKHQVKSSKDLFASYVSKVLRKNTIRSRFCGSPQNSAGCFERLKALKLEELLEVQKMLAHEDILLHKDSGPLDVEEFLIKEFSNHEVHDLLVKNLAFIDKQRVPFLILQMEKKDNFLNDLAKLCQRDLKVDKEKLHLASTEVVNPDAKLATYLNKSPLSTPDSKDIFENLVTSMNNPEMSGRFFSTCLENADKSPAAWEIRNAYRKGAIEYSQQTHQVFFFEEFRGSEGKRLYGSTSEKLLSEILLQTPDMIVHFKQEKPEEAPPANYLACLRPAPVQERTPASETGGWCGVGRIDQGP